MENKIIRIPISQKQRLINTHGNGFVPCEVSGRWLQFPEESAFIGEKNLMFVDVMTYGDNDKPRKICSLCISQEDIVRALKHVEPRDQ